MGSKKLLFVLVLNFIFVSACREDIVDFSVISNTSKIIISSSPRGAEILINESRSGKVTPDSLINLQPGAYTFKLRLTGYPEETVYVNIGSGQTKYLNVIFRNH